MQKHHFQARRLAPFILAGVAVFALVVGGILASNRRAGPVEPGPGVASADLTVRDASIREESGAVRWHLTAKQAMVFDREGRTSLRDIAVEVEEPARSWTIRGEEGDLFHTRNDVEIRRRVVLTSSDGLRLETDVLRWSNSDRRVWTDAPVTITHPSGVIKGSGLDVRVPEETTTVSGRVRAVFRRPAP
jgi:LPS export ABC transporter protein LptC